MTVSDAEVSAAIARFQLARAEAGLSPLISDQETLRLIAAIFGSNQHRKSSEPDEAA